MIFNNFFLQSIFTRTKPLHEMYDDADNLEQLLKAHIAKPTTKNESEKMSVTEILNHVGIDEPDKSQLNQAGKILREMNIETKKSNGLTRRLVMLIN